MKRRGGIKVKTGIRAPARIETPGEIAARNSFHQAPLVPLIRCTVDPPCWHCFYCKMWAAENTYIEDHV